MFAILAWTVGAHVAMAAGPAPDFRIALEPLGYETLLPEFLLEGNSLLTVDFVDRDHLLVTFAERKLLKRDLDPGPDDDDRMIGAVVVDIPSGKAVARSEWRVHDRGQYLWNLGHGRFLLRVKDRLTVFSPMRGMALGDAFRQEPLFDGPRHVVAVLVSSNDDLLTIETTARPGVQIASDGAPADHSPVQVNFYRLSDAEGGKLQLAFAGVIRTQDAVEFPMTSAGMLHITQGGANTWLFDFDEHAGKVDQLLAFDTSCAPRSTFVSQSQFVVFGCRGSDGRRDLAGFNLKGDEMWQQNFFEQFVAPTFAFAPAAGRFALSRTIVAAPTDVSLLAPTQVTGQDVRVYQMNSGKVLLKVDCTPVIRSGENFALSEDGTRLAVIRQEMVHHAATAEFAAWNENSTGVDIYELPPLSAQDRAAVQEAQKMAPLDSGARIDVALARISARQTAATVAAEIGVPVSGNGQAAATAGAAAASPTQDPSSAPEPGNPAMNPATNPSSSAAIESGADTTAPDAGVNAPAPRQAPTLYEPGEKHQNPQQPE